MHNYFLTTHEVTLFKNSEAVKNTKLYGNLYEVISNFQGKKVDSISQIPQLDKKAINVLMNDRESLKKSVIEEWETIGYSYDPTQHAHCNLCHRDNNKYVFYVRNNKNQVILNVGSICIDRFPKPKDFNIQEGLMFEDRTQRSFMNRASISLYEFSQYAYQFINVADRYFSLLPILLPYNLYYGMQESISKMKNLYNDSPTTYLEQILVEWRVYWELKYNANNFVQDNIRHPFICRRKEIDWMLEHNKIDLLDTIAQNDGVYTYDTIKHIYSESIIIDYLQLIIRCNRSPYFIYGKYDNESIEVIFNKNGYTHQIHFQITLHDLIKYLGCYCIMIDNYTYGTDDIIRIAHIQNIQSNIISIIDYTVNMMFGLYCEFLYDGQENQLFIRRLKDGSIAKIDTINFLISYQKLIQRPDDKIKKDLKRIINSIDNWMSVSTQIKNGIFKKMASLYTGNRIME